MRVYDVQADKYVCDVTGDTRGVTRGGGDSHASWFLTGWQVGNMAVSSQALPDSSRPLFCAPPSTADPFEQCEIVCACSLGGNGEGGGGEVVLGSVHGAYCSRCLADGIPSLCNHKQAVGEPKIQPSL